MPVLTWRDVWPVENPDGEAHWGGSECPCCPWSFTDGTGTIVVVHEFFREQIIHTSAVDDEAIIDEVPEGTDWGAMWA